MGLDTRAYRKSTQEWKEQWVIRQNEAGGRPVVFGLLWEPVGQKNYGLTGGYVGGTPPLTLEDAPDLHQVDLEQLDWPGGLIGGMISSNGTGPSFRGKAYNDYVEAVTGESLYSCIDAPWDGVILDAITFMLEGAVDEAPNAEADEYAPAREEREALARWFRVCSDNGLAVSGDC
jgi:hypothetical protein